MSRITALLGTLICTAVLFFPIHAATYYLDAGSGNDDTGDGSQGSPWQTVAKVMTVVTGGDEVILAAGTYDGYDNMNQTLADETDWITFKPAAGATVHIAEVRTGHWSSANRRDRYIRFEHLEIDSACASLNANYVAFSNCVLHNGITVSGCTGTTIDSCLLEMFLPWTGPDDIDKFTVAVRGSRNFTLTNSEITNTAGAVSCEAESVTISGNYIHDITHDGIRVTGIRHGLLEGNTICRLDDGVYDSTTANVDKYGADSCASWSRHCDAIHIFIAGSPCSTIIRNYDVTIRGNTLYDVDAQHIQINNYYACDVRNAKLLFENNIFGPSAANPVNMADPADTVVFRNNTFLYFPEGRIFSSPFRDIPQDNYTFRISDNYTEVYVYNNILVNAWEGNTVFCDYNLFRTNTQNHALGRYTIVDSTDNFIDVAAFDGKLISTSAAVDAGTKDFGPTDIFPNHPTDFYGTTRDVRPDIGAYELPGQDPDPEPKPTTDNGPKYTFIDDFVDNDFEIDPWLDSVGVQGLSWIQEENDSADYELAASSVLEANAVRAQTGTGRTWLYSEQGIGSWLEYTVRFDAANAYLTEGDGLLVLARDINNYYWIEIGRDHGRIWRMLDGVATVLDSSPDIEMPHSGKRVYAVSVNADTDGITISVDADRDDSTDITVTDTDAAAIAHFSAVGGGIGLYRYYSGQYNKINYANFRVDVTRFVPGTGMVLPDRAAPADVPHYNLSTDLVTDMLTVTMEPGTRLDIYSATGTRLDGNRRGRQVFTWDSRGLPAGAYYLKFNNGRTAQIRRVIKLK